MIYTAFNSGAYQYIFEIGGVYILTAILAIFIYFSRLYTNRTVLAAVGKSYIPVEDGEVGKTVRKMIVKAMERSAIIALESRPRDFSNSLDTIASNSTAMGNEKVITHPAVGRVLRLDPSHPPWGRVEHPGWSTPSQTETSLPPHVHFRTVIHELPNLIEAKAVSLAPPDPCATPTSPGKDDTQLADPIIVDLLRRRPHADLRTYLGHLSSLGLINPPEVGEGFLWQYERARFSCVPLTESQFADLMQSFAVLLAGMEELSSTIIGEVRANHLGNDISSISELSISSSSRSGSLAGSVRRTPIRPTEMTPGGLQRSVTGASYRTAPSSAIQFRTPGAFSSRTTYATPGAFSSTTTTYVTPSRQPRTTDSHYSSIGPVARRQTSNDTIPSVGSVLLSQAVIPDDASLSSGSSPARSVRSVRSRSLRSYAGSVVRHVPVRGEQTRSHEWTYAG